jgi:hypothetical protein
MRFNYHGYSGLTSISSDPGYHPLRSLGSNNAALAKNRKTATEPIHFQNVAGKNFFSLDGKPKPQANLAMQARLSRWKRRTIRLLSPVG